MRIARVRHGEQAFYALREDGAFRRLTGLPYDGLEFTGEAYASEDVALLAPAEPSKIVAVGRNYEAHAREMQAELPPLPLLFIKPSTSALAPGGGIIWPEDSQRVDYEAELGVVIGRECRNVSPEDAGRYIFGYTALNDVTARDLQKADGQWTRGKGFDTFCPFGPYVDTGFDPRGKRVRSVLNGEIRQDGCTDDMIYSAEALVAFISRCMTLLPGDVVATGTPEGVGPMKKGDTIEIRIEGLEPLVNHVR